jgi:hypothetical protein
MKTVKDFNELPYLPEPAKRLISQGYYSLYSVQYSDEKVQYLLRMGRDKFYYLNSKGMPLTNQVNIDDNCLKIVDHLTFDLPKEESSDLFSGLFSKI